MTALLLLLVWSSCTNTATPGKADTIVAVNDSVKTSASSPAPGETMQAEPVDGIACYYVLDNKNAGSPDSTTLYRWMSPFLQQLANNGIDTAGSLIGGKHGSGPMNAEWNPDADLLIVARFPFDANTDSVGFYANGYLMHPQHSGVLKAQNGGSSLCWYILPKMIVNVQRHLPSAEEVKTICATKGIPEKNWQKNSCTVVNVSVKVKRGKTEEEQKGFVLIAYGS